LLAEDKYGKGPEDAMSSSAVEDLARSIYRLATVQRALARHALAELGSRGFTALGVAHRVGPVRVSEIADRLSVDLSVASRQVAALERAGYVTREADPDDRRAHRISITDAGTKVLAESHRRMVAAFEEALGDWDEDELTGLSTLLDRLREDFAGTAGTPDLPKETTTR
jgi:DNA-binding MarR family transcriptional regulator